MKLRIIGISAIIFFILIVVGIIFPIFIPSNQNLYNISLYEGIANNNFNYLQGSTNGGTKKHIKQYDYDTDEPVTTNEFMRNKESVGVSAYKTELPKKGTISSYTKHDEMNEMQGSATSAGLYFSRGRGKTENDLAMNTSSLSLNSTNDSKPFTNSTPQMASSATTAGGDPGGDPTGDPLPLKDDLVVLSLLLSVYSLFTFIKKSRLK